MAEVNVQREISKELKEAQKLLQSPALSDSGCHSIRKHLKRSRSYLRLLKPSFTRSGYQELNRSIRDVGRALSPARDYSVRQQTAKLFKDSLRKKFATGEKPSPPKLLANKSLVTALEQVDYSLSTFAFPKRDHSVALKKTLRI